MKKLILAGILAIPMVSTTYAQQEMSASGEVVAVRMLTRTLTVRDQAANEVIRYSVPLGTTVTLAGQSGRLGYLRNGDMVNVSYVNTDDGREARIVRVPQPNSAMDLRIQEGDMSTVTGVIQSVNPSKRTITILGDQTGERFTYAVPEDARLTFAGEKARMNDFKRGDNAILRFNSEDKDLTVARVRVPTPVATLETRRVASEPVAMAATPRQLPRTASSLPLFALFGAIALLLAGSLNLARRTQ